MTEVELKLKELCHRSYIKYCLCDIDIRRFQKQIDHLKKEQIKILKEFNLD